MNQPAPVIRDFNSRLPYRIVVAACLLVLGFAVIGWRLFDLQYRRHNELAKRVQDLHKTHREIPAMRGPIRDCNGELLAHDKPVFDIWVNSKHIHYLPDVKQKLSKLVHVPVDQLVKQSTSDVLLASYSKHVAAVLANAICAAKPETRDAKEDDINAMLANEKRVEFPVFKGVAEEDVETWRKLLEDSHVSGVTLRPSVKRFYPCDERLTHVLGFVDHQHEGREGVEAVMNSQLIGTNGRQQIERDRKGREITAFRGETIEPKNGNDVRLTIDMHLQEVLEDALEEKLEYYQPKKIIGIIVEPKTGAILAMSSRPLPEHHDREAESTSSKRRKVSQAAEAFVNTASPAIADQYEPGSVFKLITFAGVFDRKLAELNELINCDPEQKACAALKLHDHVNGKVSVAQVLALSSNVGTYMLARRLGEDSFVDYLGRFGFGKKSGISLTGEIRGDVLPRSSWDSLTFSRMAIGHSISVTPLQMAMATAAIANGGVLMKPQIIREVRDEKGNILQPFKPEEVTRVCSEQAASLVTKAMERVMTDEHGTGHNKVVIPGVRVAGKTGTSQRRKDNGRGYDVGHYAVSFAGFAPAENPSLCAIIVVDDPHAPADELSGGILAGPIFAQIMRHSLNHMAVAGGPQAKGGAE